MRSTGSEPTRNPTVLIVLLLLASCTASSSPTTTQTPRWCPHTDPASGQRYYVTCEQP